MKKKFYKHAAYAVIGTSVLSVLFSVIYFIASENIDPESTFLEILYYVKLVFDMLASFTGYFTIMYAVTKFGWFDGVISVGLYFCSVLIFFVYQTVASTIYYNDTVIDTTTGAGVEEDIISLITYNAFYSLGQLIITLMVPAAIVALVSYKIIKNDVPFEKPVSLKNPTQKAMVVSCVILFLINFLSYPLFSVLPYLIKENFYIMRDDFYDIITQIGLSFVEMGIAYLVLQYIAFMLGFKYYDKCLGAKVNAVADKK